MTVVVLAHLVAAVVSPVAFRRWGRTCFYALALVPAASFLWLLTLAPQVLSGHPVEQTLSWIPQLHLSLDFRLDALSWVLSALVLGLGSLILFYCASYFRHTQQHTGAFGGELVAFAGVMFGLVVSDDVMVMLVFWETTSVLSFLLVGFASTRLSARRAALQALVVTTAGGLAMFLGLVMLATASGSYRFSEIIARAPQTVAAPGHGIWLGTALVLVLAGAVSKSALFPLHFWLPGAMAAPTPVSAFLHAAAMVKAGLYLIARLAPAFHAVDPWTPVLTVLGLFTMVFGGWTALKQQDLKLVLAYGTVSQLGFLALVLGLGTPDAVYAGLGMLVAHALFKSALFLVTGIIDHQAGTREISRLSGIWRQAPVLCGAAAVSAASMAGLPVFLGFVAKESVLEVALHGAAAHHLGTWGPTGAWAVLLGVSLGSVLTLAYSARFVWGAFADKPAATVHPDLHGPEGVRSTGFHEAPAAFALAPVLVTVATVVLGLWPEPVHQTVGAAVEEFGETSLHLALWHGLTPALGLSGGIVLLGVLLFLARTRVEALQQALPSWPPAEGVYRAVLDGLDHVARRVTGLVQRGSLSFYLSVILAALVLVPTAAVAAGGAPPLRHLQWQASPAQWATVTMMAVAALVVLRAHKRFLAILMVSVTGYGIAFLFILRGAPDLALTQMLVETISLIAFVLALRMLPAGMKNFREPQHRGIRVALSVGFGLFMMAVAAFALSARTGHPVSREMPHLAHEIGHGLNVVNVILVDIRGWDTYGEISVLALAATGVASLLFLDGRADHHGSGPDVQAMEQVAREHAQRDGLDAEEEAAGSFHDVQRDPFLVAGHTLAPENRSLILEVVTRVMFHSIMMVSVYLLLAGHNLPGGGFAGGLLAGLALALRYLAGGRYELEEATPVPAGVLLGAGFAVAGLYALAPLAWGDQVFTSYALDLHLPLFGSVHLVTALVFDIGVYLVVVGLVLDVLRSLGGRVDRDLDEERAASTGGATAGTEEAAREEPVPGHALADDEGGALS